MSERETIEVRPLVAVTGAGELHSLDDLVDALTDAQSVVDELLEDECERDDLAEHELEQQLVEVSLADGRDIAALRIERDADNPLSFRIVLLTEEDL